MRGSVYVSLAVASSVLAAPQGISSKKEDDSWADWDTIVGSIDVVGPELMKAALPGSKIEQQYEVAQVLIEF
jgi:hypothetical protein